MFNMGIGEIFLIFVVLVLVVGPEKLPGFAKTIAKYMGEFNKAKNEIKHAVLSPSDEAEFRSLMHGNGGVVERRAKGWMGEDFSDEDGKMDPRLHGEDRAHETPPQVRDDKGSNNG